ncbi:alpha-L-fucosidase [Puniceicoccaceae bacterium K14]|nr:alpha-L-fucosidase [Puniceicoccaceae bacterium K14]
MGIRTMILLGCLAGATIGALSKAKPHVPAMPRLQVDIGEGSPDLQWWRDAQAIKEERMDWWREARFGCFIHWNASSVLGSEWNGKAYSGYAEHIQRMAKIPCDVYRREAAGNFDPENFDADEWVRAAREAGMRYLIITAKHHDGFAMYDSKVSDNNIVDASPFGKDPMKALKAACDKHNLKFGFYYSHAFDWGEPNGVGNDWEYDNPGGDKHLHGGGNWFDVHPEMVPRFRTYVDEKAIPQVQELIRNYDPDIMWFDTPHKLPPEENLRILQAVRTAKPSIVVNSRIVQDYENSPGPFGDYKSTGDRAVDFRAEEGDWETIPTTNESYGYSKHDLSHKTPDYLVQVLVKAAARGGNMLLNVGPRGDGMIDSIDLGILAGIGKWMDVNEASIRGTVRTTLPVQPWGESTRKGNLLYLHVFDWPSDGQLEVGGFEGAIEKAWLLSDSKKAALKHRRIDGKTVQVDVARSAQAAENSVVVLEVDDAENTSSERLLSAKQSNALRAFDAVAMGGEFRYGNGKALYNGVGGWKSDGQKLIWPVYLLESGTYTVEAEYSLKEGAPLNQYSVTVGEAKLTSTTKGAGAHRNIIYVKHKLGRIEILKGSNMIEISPEGKPDEDLMTLRALHLTPIDVE